MTAETLRIQAMHIPNPNYFFLTNPSEIKFGKMKFLITDQPHETTLETFIKELERHKTKAVVRVCEPTYHTDILKSHGIDVKDWEFHDGQPPPQEVINKWLDFVKEVFKTETDSCIAVHCVAGLGRAPVLVAVALLEAGMGCEEAITEIRSQRRGALNDKQLEFIRNYKPSGQLRKLRHDVEHRKSCAIM